MNTCPKGHPSNTADYCDECGSPMDLSHTASAAAAPPPNGAEMCPECKTPREAGARFCEVCQYDFINAKPGMVISESRVVRADALARQALAAVASNDASELITSPPRAVPRSASEQAPAPLSTPLLVRVQSDPSLCPDEESRQSYPPEGIPEFIYHLDLDENLIGRESASKNSHPEIPLRDPGASRRHMKIARIDGKFQALELGSANGTTLDGHDLSAGRPVPIVPGAVIRIGIWTRIVIEAR